MRRSSMMVFCAATLVLTLFVFFPGQGQAKSWPKAIAIAAGHPGGGVYTIATGMAAVINKYQPKVKAAAEVGSFGKNIVLLHNKEVDFAMAQCDFTHDAARGIGIFKKYGKMRLRLMFSGSTPPGAFIVKANSGITKLQDLEGKTVMGDMPTNATFTNNGDLILASAGMTRKNFKDIKFTSPKAGREALKEGRVDAFICLFPSIGKTAWAEELNMQVPIRLISGEEKAMGKVIEDIRFARLCKLYGKYYRQMVNNKDLVTIGFPHVFLARPDFPDDFVAEILNIFYSHLEELYGFHLEAKAYLADPLQLAVLPYHPGAIKYYKEKGLWTDKLEKRQQKLLKEVGASK